MPTKRDPETPKASLSQRIRWMQPGDVLALDESQLNAARAATHRLTAKYDVTIRNERGHPSIRRLLRSEEPQDDVAKASSCVGRLNAMRPGDSWQVPDGEKIASLRSAASNLKASYRVLKSNGRYTVYRYDGMARPEPKAPAPKVPETPERAESRKGLIRKIINILERMEPGASRTFRLENLTSTRVAASRARGRFSVSKGTFNVPPTVRRLA
jgi:hypothetical protein